MRNKNVGFLIIGVSFVIGIIIYIFNRALKDITSSSCDMGKECAMYRVLTTQTWTSIALAGLVFIIGLFLILSREHEKVIIKKIKPTADMKPRKFSEKSLKGLEKNEASVMNLLLKNNGSMFQSEIVEKAGFDKVKVSRILDRLEGQGFIERRRRGMTNIVILK